MEYSCVDCGTIFNHRSVNCKVIRCPKCASRFVLTKSGAVSYKDYVTTSQFPSFFP
jgi:DNA-directed RNA polymerase subunit RPC12/RpoP